MNDFVYFLKFWKQSLYLNPYAAGEYLYDRMRPGNGCGRHIKRACNDVIYHEYVFM